MINTTFLPLSELITLFLLRKVKHLKENFSRFPCILAYFLSPSSCNLFYCLLIIYEPFMIFFTVHVLTRALTYFSFCLLQPIAPVISCTANVLFFFLSIHFHCYKIKYYSSQLKKKKEKEEEALEQEEGEEEFPSPQVFHFVFLPLNKIFQTNKLYTLSPGSFLFSL